ncbi:hypothetical protein N790_15005, partial [Arenimonas malthae CC-JY-1]
MSENETDSGASAEKRPRKPRAANPSNDAVASAPAPTPVSAPAPERAPAEPPAHGGGERQ